MAMKHLEPLPEGCPPDEAEEISSPLTVYRLVRNTPPTGDDFRSQRDLKPTTRFNISECQARGLSVFGEQIDAQALTRRRNLKDMAICQLTLTEGAGHIMKTGGRSHHTWWPYAGYDILAACTMVIP